MAIKMATIEEQRRDLIRGLFSLYSYSEEDEDFDVDQLLSDINEVGEEEYPNITFVTRGGGIN
ncbi:MAG TPA: hypothetical protein VMX17_07300 [Candidatus Glassbacteria bacterium]|nr:hypothetical protein [Candidatus Glassbacteria bacterium]